MDLTPLTAAHDNETTALIRTDRSDDAAWAAILDAINTPVDTIGDGDYEEVPNVTPLDDPSFAGATGESIASAAGEESLGYALLADAQSMAEAVSGGDATLVYVDLSCPDEQDAADFNTFMGRSFRCLIPEVAAIDVNLALGNMDFHEFADYADERDGVFRGFDAGGM